MPKQSQSMSHEKKNPVRARSQQQSQIQKTAVSHPPSLLQKANLSPQEVQTLQRTIGNQALRRLTIQRKMTLGPVGDKYEQEADAVAKQVVGSLSSNGGGGKTAVIQAKSGGAPLSNNVRQPMEQAFNADFSSVKIHTGGQADNLNRSLGARAFTNGQDVFFRQGEYNPGSSTGQELIAHELTHTIQQGAVPVNNQVQTARYNQDLSINKVSNGAVSVQRVQISQNLSNKNDSDAPLQTRRRSNAFSAKVTGSDKKYGSDYSDFDSKQFRVSGKAPNRRIEEVKRTQTHDGKVIYYAMGLVTAFKGNVPVIAPYPEPISMGDWYPKVTHINGMAVTPKSGILNATALQESVNKAIGGDNDVALGQEAVDILFTYSAQRGNPIVDVWDCIKGKVQIRDQATEKQEEIMLDAVRRKKRVTVSAHSRGTIKTDNAVRNVHKILTNEFYSTVRQDSYEDAVAYWKMNNPGIGLDPEILAEMSMKPLAQEEAKKAMNAYIQLIYAGNAVQYPSAVLKFDMYVGGLDPISMFVGTYSEIGRKVHAAIGIGGSSDSKLHSVGKTKGHRFVKNYVPSVGQKIAEDLKTR